MKFKQVMMMRLSPTWLNMDPEAIRDLAKHLYSLYTLFQLDDPLARLAWGLGNDKDGAIYIIVFEFHPDQGRSEDSEGKTEVPTIPPESFEFDIDVTVETEGGIENGPDQDDDDLALEPED